jgi:hypothetical protein
MSNFRTPLKSGGGVHVPDIRQISLKSKMFLASVNGPIEGAEYVSIDGTRARLKAARGQAKAYPTSELAGSRWCLID